MISGKLRQTDDVWRDEKGAVLLLLSSYILERSILERKVSI
jgi:hypothetical protein